MNTAKQTPGRDLSTGIVGHKRLLAGVIGALLAASSSVVYADAAEAPSNEELYRMIQELKSNQDALRNEAAMAKADAAAARAELAKVKSAPASSGVSEASDPGAFVRLENTFFSYGQEGGVHGFIGGSGDAADFGSEYAPRVEAGYIGSQGMGIRARYWNFDDTASFLNGGVVPDKVSVDTDYLDLEVFQQWQLTPNTELEGAVGLRHLDFSHRVHGTVTGIGTKGDFNGWGATAALQVKRKLGIGKVYGRGRLSALVGDHNVEVTDFGVTIGENDNDNSPVTQTELAFGYEIDRDFTWGKLNVNLGYEWQYWTNLAPADNTFITGFNAGDDLENVSFDGFVLGIGARF